MVTLEFVWGLDRENNDDDKDVLEGLQPHPNLKSLGINGYRGQTFPSWFDSDVSSSLPYLVEITVENCSNVECFPSSLGALPLLRILVISRLRSVKFFLANSSDDGANAFPSLEYLKINGMDELEDWFPGVNSNSNQVTHHFPSLRILKISNCRKLKRLPPSSLSSLQILTMERNCNPMTLGSLKNLPTLSSLLISNFDDITCFPEGCLQNLPSLKSLSIWNCDSIQALPLLMGTTSLADLSINACPSLTNVSLALRHQTSLQSLKIAYCPKAEISAVEYQHLSSLQSLDIEGFNDMMALPDGLQHLSSTLRRLEISDWSALNSVPDWIGSFTNLTTLHLFYCTNLTSLPDGIQQLTNLQPLWIKKCHTELHRRCERETGEDWPKIAHVPHLINDLGYQ